MAGICLRGQPGWGQLFAPLTTVVNTFGGTWFEKDWTPKVNAPEFKRGDQLLRQPRARLRRERRSPGGLHRVPQQPDPGQRRRCGTTPPRPRARSRPRTRPSEGKIGYAAAPVVKTEELRLALRVVVEHPSGEHEAGERLEVHLVGVGQGVRAARRRRARLVARPCRQARLDLRQPRIPRRGRRLRRADQGRHRVRRPGQPRSAAPAGTRHPVRRHPRVPRPRHPGQPGRQLRDRRARRRSTRRSTRARSSPRTSQSATSHGRNSEHRNHDRRGHAGLRASAPAVDAAAPRPVTGHAARRCCLH